MRKPKQPKPAQAPVKAAPAQELTEEQFYAQFKPKQNKEGSDTWQYHEVKDLDLHHVWSLLEVEDIWYACPGFHVVNVVGYCVTQVAWTDEGLTAVYMDFKEVS